MSLSPVSEACQIRSSLAVAVSQTTYTLVVRHAVSVVALEKKALSTASTAPITHAKAIGHGKQWLSSYPISMELLPALRILNLMALTTGSMYR
jgi:hypothetical protein